MNTITIAIAGPQNKTYMKAPAIINAWTALANAGFTYKPEHFVYVINPPRKYLPLSHTSYSHFQKTIGWYPVVFVNCEEARTCSLGALLGWSVSFQHAHFA